MIEIISAKVNLNKTFLKMQLSLDDIKKSHPHRKDIIDSMSESLDDLAQAQVILHRLDVLTMSQSSQLHRQERIILELQEKNILLTNRLFKNAKV